MNQKKEKYYTVLCKRGKNGQPVLFSKKEEEIKDNLLAKWIGNQEKAYHIVNDKIKSNELTEEEAWSYFSNMIDLPKKYQGFIDEFKALTGVEIIRGDFPESVLFPELRKPYGVYAICADDKIIYIGSTIRTFDIRFAEHQKAIQDLKQPQLDVYDLIRIFQEAGQTITYKPLIDCSKLQTNKTLTTHDIESMELALIQEHQPVGNIAGLTKPFLYHAVSEPTDGV